MRLRYLITLSIGILLVIPFLPILSSAHSQGLHWGYEEDQEFYFHERTVSEYQGNIEEMDYTFILKDSDPFTIEDPLTNDSQPPQERFDVYWLNGTSAADGFFVTGYYAAVPIGNWSLLTQIFQTHFDNQPTLENVTYNYQFQESNTEWGFTGERTENPLVSNDTMEARFIYSKADGVLILYTWDSNSPVHDFYIHYSLARLPMHPETQNLLATSLAIGVIAVAVVVASKFRK